MKNTSHKMQDWSFIRFLELNESAYLTRALFQHNLKEN